MQIRLAPAPRPSPEDCRHLPATAFWGLPLPTTSHPAPTKITIYGWSIRTFLPDTFAAVIKAQEALTKTVETFGGRGDESHLKQSIDELVTTAGDHGDIARALIVRVFPAGQRFVENMQYGAEWLRIWLRGKRVAHIDILRLYLERIASEGLTSFTQAERAYALLTDERQLDEFLRSIDMARLEDVIAALEAYEDEYPVESIVSATVVLLNLLPELPERPRGMMTFVDARLVVARVVLRLLRRLPGPAQVEAAVDDIMPRIRKLSSKLELVTIVGHREGAGHKLVSEEAARRLERDLESEIRSATADQLLEEQDLLRLLLVPARWEEDAPAVLGSSASPELNAKVLMGSRSEVRSQAVGSRAVRTSMRLSWDALVKVYGGEDQVRAAVESVRPLADSNEQLAETIRLADRYLTGWRPDRDDD